MEDIEQSAGAAFPVSLSHAAGVTGSYSTETYLVLPIESLDQTELFFFRDKVKPKNIVGILPAVRQWADNECVSDAKVLYGKCGDDGCAIEAILVATGTYHVMSRFQQPVIGPAVSETDCAKVRKQEAELRKQEKSRSEVVLGNSPDK